MENNGYIAIPMCDLARFTPGCREEILGYMTSNFELGQASSNPEVSQSGAALSTSQAREYLNNCSEVSIQILADMVERNGDFMMSDIANLTGKTTLQLRGAFSGLTKRVRTISGDSDAMLIEWLKTSDGDWHGTLHARTVEAFRDALNERGQ